MASLRSDARALQRPIPPHLAEIAEQLARLKLRISRSPCEPAPRITAPPDSGQCPSDSASFAPLPLPWATLAPSPCEYLTTTCALHEILGVVDQQPLPSACASLLSTSLSDSSPIGSSPLGYRQSASSFHWSRPLLLLCTLARRLSSQLMWVGENTWPSIWSLGANPPEAPLTMLERSFFVGIPSTLVRDEERAARLWAAELALRAGVTTIVDGRGFDRADTQRLQIAARHGACACISIRPAHEASMLSAAASRWLVARANCASSAGIVADISVWSLALHRLKGSHPSLRPPQEWIVAHDHQPHPQALSLTFLPVVCSRYSGAPVAASLGPSPLGPHASLRSTA